MSESTARDKMTRRMVEAAERYATFDKSDPFSYDRCISHMMHGVSSPGSAKKAYYDADMEHEKRHYTNAEGNRVEYLVPRYTNMTRP